MSRWAIDLDGVVWRGSELLEGADRAVASLLGAGIEVVFCTNHACSPTVKEQHLARLGVPAAPVVTSAESAAAQCTPGGAVLALGDPSLVESLAAVGLEVVDVWDLPDGSTATADTVVVGSTERWDRSRIGMVADAVRAGARFLATNDDSTYPVVGPDGPRLLPGNGALVAAVEIAAGRRAEVTGKPHPSMAELLVTRHGPVDVVVGDKPETDGGLAEALDAHFGLVLSGVTTPADLPVSPAPALVGKDLASLVAEYLGSGPADPVN